MMRVEISRRCGVFALLLATSLLCPGCGGKGAGDTVPSPPRELVDKSFHPPTNGGPPMPAPATSGKSAPTSAGK